MTDVIFAKNDGENAALAIKEAIKTAVETKTYSVAIKGGVWKIKETILLPDDIKIIVDGALLKWTGESGGYMMANSNAFTSFAQTIAAQQSYICICGENGAKLDGAGVLLRNVSDCSIQNLAFTHCEYGTVLTSTIGIRVKNITFCDCKNGVALGCGASDCFLNDISGKVDRVFIETGGNLFSDMYKLYHPRASKNVIIRGVNASAENILKIDGAAEKILINDVVGTATKVAFDIKTGKHLVINGAKVNGKIINDDFPKNHVVIQ